MATARRKPKEIIAEPSEEQLEQEEREDLAGDTEVSPEQVDNWYTIIEASEVLGKTHQWIRKLIRQGRIHPMRDSKGCVRVEPAEIERFAVASNMAVENQTDVIRILSESATAHMLANQKLVALVPDTVGKLLHQQNDLIERCFTRIATLEKERSEMIAAVEDANTLRQVREADKLMVEKAEERKDTALSVLVEQGPKLIEQFLIGSDVSKLIASLDPALLEGLTSEDSPLTEDQKSRLVSITKRLEKKKLALVTPKPESEEAAATADRRS